MLTWLCLGRPSSPLARLCPTGALRARALAHANAPAPQRPVGGSGLTVRHGHMQLVDVNMPLDNATGKHRGFGFVEFESPEDAAEAIYNMNNGELNGRVLNVNVAKPMTVTERSQKAVWHADADSYFDKEGWNLDQEPSTIVVDDVKPADDGLAPKDPAQPHFG